MPISLFVWHRILKIFQGVITLDKNLIPCNDNDGDNLKITIDYVSNLVFNSNLKPGEIIEDVIIENKKKKIESPIQIINCTGQNIYFGEFDRAVLTALIREQAKGNTFTTARRIFHILGGGDRLTPAMKKAIMNSVEKFAGVRIILKTETAVKKGITKEFNGSATWRGYLMPTETLELSVNGQETDVISFLHNATTGDIKKGVIFQNATLRDQIISCAQDLADTPINKNVRNIGLTHYFLRRILSIKNSYELAQSNKRVIPLRKVITVDDMFENCDIKNCSHDQKARILKTVKTILNFFIQRNIIKNYHFETVKETGKIRSIFIDF